MKRSFFVLVFLALASAGAFAQIQMGAGGGIFFDYSGGNGIKGSDLGIMLNDPSFEGTSANIAYPSLNYGVYGFFDITYAEISFYSGFGRNKTYISSSEKNTSSVMFDYTVFGLTLLGKFPIEFWHLGIFPMAGINYNMMLSARAGNIAITDPYTLNQFGLMFGGGFDINFTNNLFLRTTGLYTLRFPSKFQNDLARIAGPNTDTTMGKGPTIRVGFGGRF